MVVLKSDTLTLKLNLDLVSQGDDIKKILFYLADK